MVLLPGVHVDPVTEGLLQFRYSGATKTLFEPVIPALGAISVAVITLEPGSLSVTVIAALVPFVKSTNPVGSAGAVHDEPEPVVHDQSTDGLPEYEVTTLPKESSAVRVTENGIPTKAELGTLTRNFATGPTIENIVPLVPVVPLVFTTEIVQPPGFASFGTVNDAVSVVPAPLTEFVVAGYDPP